MNGAQQRRKEDDEEAEEMSRGFIRNLPEGVKNQPVGKALVIHDDVKQRAQVRDILEQFEAAYNPADAVSKSSRELEAAAKDMLEALKSLDTITKGSIFKKFSRDKSDDTPAMNSIKTRYQKMCHILADYSELFKFIPSDDKYIKLLTGTMETIVTATVNHTTIGQGFADGIDYINTELNYCASSLQLAKARSSQAELNHVRTRVLEIFTLCFKFLAPYTRWFASRFERFKGSLNKNYYEDHVEGPLKVLREKSKELERENAMQGLHKLNDIDGTLGELLRVTNRKHKDRNEEISLSFSNGEALMAQLQHLTMEIREVRKIGEKANGQNLLAAKRHIQERDEQLRGKKAHMNWGKAMQGAKMKAIPPSTNLGSRALLPWDDIEAASWFLEAVADSGYPIDIREPEDFRFAPAVFQPLESWLTSQESEWLWMRGPSETDELSEVSTAAYYTVMVGERLKIPFLAYRFRGDEGLAESIDAGAEDRSIEMDRLVLMVYSIIRQLVWRLPDQVETDIDLSAERFRRLDGSTESILDAFNLIEGLLCLMPKVLIVVLDGFQLVDNDNGASGDGTFGYLELLLDVLRSAGASRTLKVLITSDGLCRALLEEDVIDLDEQVRFEQGENGIEQMPGLLELYMEEMIDAESSAEEL